jgi:hypothetical protein
MNSPIPITPAATPSTTPAKDHAAQPMQAPLPVEAPKVDAAPAKAEAIPTKV